MATLSKATALLAFAGAIALALPHVGHAQSPYGLSDLLRDARKALERGIEADRPANPPGPPPLPLANPLRSAQKGPQATKPQQHQDKDRAPMPGEPTQETDARDATSLEGQAYDSQGATNAAEAPLPEPNPVRTGKIKLPPPHPSVIAAPDWTDEEIAKAKARCKTLISSDAFGFEPLEPIREGICGAPAPIRLTSIQAGAKVEITPPATLTCDLAAQLQRWLTDVVQPAAKTHLGEPIVALRSISSFSCRNVYNDLTKSLSHHGRANALDISNFETQSGARVVLLDDWNQMVAAKAPEKTQSANEALALESPDNADGAPGPQRGDGGRPVETIIRGVTALDPTAPAPIAPAQSDGEPPRDEVAKDGSAPPCCHARQQGDDAGGQQMDQQAAAPLPLIPGPKQLFLRTLHQGACGIFGTVLGPQANAAHRDHFHLDAKKRRAGFCE